MEGQSLANSAHAQIIAPSTLSWHKALPRLMLYEVIDLDLSPDKAAQRERERFSLTRASLMAVWQLSWIRHVWLGCMQHIWEPPVSEHSVLWSARSDVVYTHLEACSCHQTWSSQPFLHVWIHYKKSYSGDLVESFPVSWHVLFVLFPIVTWSLRQSWKWRGI